MAVDMNGHYVIDKGYGSFISNTENELDAVEPVPAEMKSSLAVQYVEILRAVI